MLASLSLSYPPLRDNECLLPVQRCGFLNSIPSTPKIARNKPCRPGFQPWAILTTMPSPSVVGMLDNHAEQTVRALLGDAPRSRLDDGRVEAVEAADEIGVACHRLPGSPRPFHDKADVGSASSATVLETVGRPHHPGHPLGDPVWPECPTKDSMNAGKSGWWGEKCDTVPAAYPTTTKNGRVLAGACVVPAPLTTHLPSKLNERDIE